MSGESSLLGRGTWFNPGPATLVVRPAGWILLVPGVKSSLIASAWRVLGEPPAADALLGDLASGSEFETEDRLPPVLFALGDGTSRTIGLTGTSPLAVYTAEGRSLLAGTEEGPAVITELADVRRIAFGDLPAEDPVAALRSVEGMSRVRGFVLMTTDPAELEEAARTQLAEQVEADGSSILDPAAKERAAQRKEARAKEKREREERRAQEASARAESSAASSSSRDSSSSARRAAAEAPAGPSMFDDLFAPSAAAQASPPQSDAAVSPERLPEAPPVTAPQTADAPEREPAAAAPEPSPVETAPAPSPAPEPAPAETAQAPATAPAGTAAAHPPQSPAPGRSARLVTSSLFDRRASRSGQRRTEGATNRASQPSATSTVTGDGDQAPTPAEDPAADAAPVTRVEPIDPEAADPEAIDTDTDASAGTPEAGTAPSPDAAPPHSDAPPHTDPAVPAPRGEPGPAEPEADPPQVSARAAGASDLGAVIGEGGSAYDDLFGRTLHRSIEAAAVRAAGEDGSAADGERASEATLDVESLDLDASGAAGEETTSDGAPADPVGSDPAFATTEDVPLESTGDFIDWVPGMGRTAPEVAHAARASERGGAERAPAAHGPVAALAGTGRADARPGDAAPPRSATSAGSPARAPAQPTGQAPTAPAQAVALPGAVCENRHANPPEATVCRWCGARIRGGVRTVARPPLGMIEISTGGRFLLDRSAIIGRRPRASRVSGDDVPQLITVPSPQQDISRSHVALRLEGWHVVAEDLRTTNGTTLLRSGEAPQRLRSGQSPVLSDGDRLDLGDGVVLTLVGRPS
ncbi:FHA domain-containing protein [Brachybacterium kimchii]|uniref:FHA domain-containing protein n=1 Tax=Brachybacterium kimchii TaxID=2942909 RepID=A0ABY4N9D6_9MICO|nr:FHA domain-containing protein [Brachybacterium kimchii]UQN29989.1 FHA domain-containing protein [Brachybacterium kimchii]